MSRRLAALIVALPLAAFAEAPPQPAPSPAPAAAPSDGAPAAAPAAPAAPAKEPATLTTPGTTVPANIVPPDPAAPPRPPATSAAPAPGQTTAPEKPSFDFSGWFVTNAYRGFGGLNAIDLPTYAADRNTVANVSKGVGIGAGQSRVRANANIPADGLLGGAKLKGLVEIDFQGPLAGAADRSLPAVRLRHVWVASTWSDLGKLQVLAGQTWGLFTGPFFADSLAHLAVPRFAGAGFLFRRAPQVRVSGELFAPVSLVWQAAALAPVDNSTSAGAGSVRVGERSGLPDFEGRVAAVYRAAGKNVAEVGLSGRYGQESWLLDAAGRNKSIDSWGGAVDARIDVPYLTVLGGAFFGQALSVYNTAAPDVKVVKTADGKQVTDVTPVVTRGFWAQGILHVLPILDLAGGLGMENPVNSDLPATVLAGSTPTSTIIRNRQYSGSAFLKLTSRWRVSAETTWYVTNTYDGMERNATQFEVGSLFSF